MKVTAITVCVDYGDILAITLPRNRQFLDRYIVVTSKRDSETIELCRQHRVECLVTEAFYERGAAFNKGAAIERAFEFAGRSGWFALLDADIVLPSREVVFADGAYDMDYLYVPKRYMVPDPRLVVGADFDEVNWENNFSFREHEEFAGYCQLFHATAPPLHSRPWYPTNWKHAGGCDSEFWMKWDRRHRWRPNFTVLHLGEDGVNWAGRVSKRLDGTVPPDAARNAESLKQLLANRDRPRPAGVGRFAGEKIEEAD